MNRGPHYASVDEPLTFATSTTLKVSSHVPPRDLNLLTGLSTSKLVKQYVVGKRTVMGRFFAVQGYCLQVPKSSAHVRVGDFSICGIITRNVHIN